MTKFIIKFVGGGYTSDRGTWEQMASRYGSRALSIELADSPNLSAIDHYLSKEMAHELAIKKANELGIVLNKAGYEPGEFVADNFSRMSRAINADSPKHHRIST